METFGNYEDRTPEQGPPPGMYVPIHFPSMAVLDERTRDGRTIMSDGFGTLDLPRSITIQTKTSYGHVGAVICGRLDEVTVDGTNVSGRGWALATEEGMNAAHLVKTQALRGNSVELAVAQEDVDVKIEDTPSGDWMMTAEFRNAKIKATCLCTTPAFDNAGAVIPDGWNVEGVDVPEEVTASLASFSTVSDWVETFREAQVAVKSEPVPADWFADPALPCASPITVTREGKVLGHVAAWGTPHLSQTGPGGRPIFAPHSKTGYAYFATGHVDTTDGMVPTGRLVISGDHADHRLNWAAAIDHYANTCAAWADVAVGEDQYGIWVAGMVRPGVSDETVHAARASALSGDWRPIGGGLELVAALSVNSPGFPIPRAVSYCDGAGVPTALLSAGTLAPRKPGLLGGDAFSADVISEAVAAGVLLADRRRQADSDLAELRRVVADDLLGDLN